MAKNKNEASNILKKIRKNPMSAYAAHTAMMATTALKNTVANLETNVLPALLKATGKTKTLNPGSNYFTIANANK